MTAAAVKPDSTELAVDRAWLAHERVLRSQTSSSVLSFWKISLSSRSKSTEPPFPDFEQSLAQAGAVPLRMGYDYRVERPE